MIEQTYHCKVDTMNKGVDVEEIIKKLEEAAKTFEPYPTPPETIPPKPGTRIRVHSVSTPERKIGSVYD